MNQNRHTGLKFRAIFRQRRTRVLGNCGYLANKLELAVVVELHQQVQVAYRVENGSQKFNDENAVTEVSKRESELKLYKQPEHHHEPQPTANKLSI